MADPYHLDLIDLMEKGIDNTFPLRDRMNDGDMNRACPMGAVKCHLHGYEPKVDSPRWYRVKEYLLGTEIDTERLPEVVKQWTTEDHPLRRTSKVSLHRAISTINDHGYLSRKAIVEWLRRELDEQERTILFGKERDESFPDDKEEGAA